jgi:hypothetical protein
LRHVKLKTIILPRQARDKHRESTQKSDAFYFSRADVKSVASAPLEFKLTTAVRPRAILLVIIISYHH